MPETDDKNVITQDETSEPLTNDRLLAISQRYVQRSKNARRDRVSKNDENWRAYRGLQDFSEKQEWQSRETTPNFPIAVDQIVGTFERSLTDSDDWLRVEPPGIGKPIMEPEIIEKLLIFFLSHLWVPGNRPESSHGIQVVVADATKQGIMEPEVTVKVWPVLKKERHYRFEKVEPTREQGDFKADELLGEKKLTPVEIETMRLCIEVVPWEDYFPDPTPACTYSIHRSRRQLHELLANPDYDEDAVKSLLAVATEEDRKTSERLAKGEREVPADPYSIEVFEAWGDIIDERTGELIRENVFWTWAGDQIIREPTDNPYWDGTRPFITAPLIRIPGSKEPKALADHAVPIWRAGNELLNLYIDGAFRSVWGVGQLRPDLLEDPDDLADGMPQGYTGVLKPNVPTGQKFYERVDSGELPNFALDAITRMEGMVNEGLAIPDTRLGQLPERAVKATEIAQAMRSSGSLYETFAARFEDTFMEPLFEKCWRLILQYVEDFSEDEIASILGVDMTLVFQSLTPEQLFKVLNKTHFKVRGLRGVASKEREFQKLSTLLNLIGSNEQFSDHFGRNFDFEKLWEALIRATGVDPSMLRLSQDPEATAEDEANAALTEATAGAQEEAAAIAGGQLNGNLGAGSGASQPNISTDVAGLRGEQSAFAPGNPNATGGEG